MKGAVEGVGRGDGGEEKTHRIYERAEVEKDRVERYNAHRLQGIAVDNVRRNDRIPHLDARREQHKRDLANDPMVRLVDADSPYDETDRA